MAGRGAARQGAGFVRVAFRLAFWELVHAPGFKAGLIDVVNRGGDSDTNGAIAGALLGARFGEMARPCHPSTLFEPFREVEEAFEKLIMSRLWRRSASRVP